MLGERGQGRIGVRLQLINQARNWSLTPILLAILAVLSCARVMAPPGGPLDRLPPRVIAVLPDSVVSLASFDDDVVFQFDEVISEGSSPNFGLGTGDLEKLVILSPSVAVPTVRWRRDRITVRPRDNWRPNTVYRVELLPGVVDLSGNRSVRGTVITFATGGPVPAASLSGRVVSWSTRRPVPQGLVEAVLMPDSLAYRTLADSTGRFTLGPIPAGEYLVFGVIDQNHDFRWDRREEFDTLRVAAGRDSVGELWAYRRDTTAVRIASTAARDSLTVGVTFSQQLNPYQVIPADSVRVLLLPDSVSVPVIGVFTQAAFDTMFRARAVVDTTPAGRAKADSIRADSTARARIDSLRADSIARARAAAAIRIPGAGPREGARLDTTGLGPLTSRPALYERLMIRLGEPLRPGARYVIVVRGIENMTRVKGEARAVLVIPEAPKPPPEPKDTTRVRPAEPPRRD